MATLLELKVAFNRTVKCFVVVEVEGLEEGTVEFRLEDDGVGNCGRVIICFSRT